MMQRVRHQSLGGGDGIPTIECESTPQSSCAQYVDNQLPALPVVQNDTHKSSAGIQDHEGASSTVTDNEDLNVSPPNINRHSWQLTLKESRLGYTWKQLLLNLLILALLVVVVVFVKTTYDAERNSVQKIALDTLMKVNVSTTLSVLRVTQGILSTLSSFSLIESLVALQWSIIESHQGLPYLDLLALSPTSGVAGALSLLRSSIASGSSKSYALLR
jgi:hypothetical protein